MHSKWQMPSCFLLVAGDHLERLGDVCVLSRKKTAKPQGISDSSNSGPCILPHLPNPPRWQSFHFKLDYCFSACPIPLGSYPSHCLLVLKFVSFKLLSPDHITTPNLASSLQLKVISISFLHSSTNLKAWWFKALFCYYFKFALYYKRYGTS